MASDKSSESSPKFAPLPTSPAFKNRTGEKSKFGITVIGFAGTRWETALWWCRCPCGRFIELSWREFQKRRSCSYCYHAKFQVTQDNLSRSREYRCWINMLNRCFDLKHKNYPNYGGRGIRPCNRFRESFLEFFADLGKQERAGLTLDRIKSELGYTCGKCPECLRYGWPVNCRWATRAEQMRNRRVSVLIEHDGQTLSAAEWAKRLGLNRSEVARRIRSGWSEYHAVTTPPLPQHKRILGYPACCE